MPNDHRQHSGPPLVHLGPCGQRIACWRLECRERFGDYATVEILRSGERLAYCHRARWHPRPVEAAA
jgi:hypothetical protein